MIQKTLKKLEELDLIEKELVSFRYRKKIINDELDQLKVDESEQSNDGLDERGFAWRTGVRRNERGFAGTNGGSPKRTGVRQDKLEPLQGKEYDPSKTIKTIQTIQTVVDGVGDNFSEGDRGIAESSPAIAEGTLLAIAPTPEQKTPSKISDTLLDQLKELEIPIDKKIREAIAKYGESQAWGAIRHIEATGDTIRSKYAVFLHQIPLQQIPLQRQEKPKKGLSPEFLEWYTYARGDKVEDVDPELLTLDRYGEPMVRLRERPQDLIEWRRVKGGEDLTPCSGEALRSALDRFPGLKAKLGRKEPAPVEPAEPTTEPEPKINEALKAAIEKALDNNPKLREKLQTGGNEG
jgi:hypothetical protein